MFALISDACTLVFIAPTSGARVFRSYHDYIVGTMRSLSLRTRVVVFQKSNRLLACGLPRTREQKAHKGNF